MIKIAAYLQVNEQRLKNLKSTIREKGHFRPFVGRPVKLDAIAEHTIVEAVKKGVETLTPLKKNTDFRNVLLKNVQETDKRLGGSGEGCTTFLLILRHARMTLQRIKKERILRSHNLRRDNFLIDS